MKRFKNWKSIALATLLPLFVAMQPAISYACEVGTHSGC
jgi:hypothetical protein